MFGKPYAKSLAWASKGFPEKFLVRDARAAGLYGPSPARCCR